MAIDFLEDLTGIQGMLSDARKNLAIFESFVSTVLSSWMDDPSWGLFEQEDLDSKGNFRLFHFSSSLMYWITQTLEILSEDFNRLEIEDVPSPGRQSLSL